MSVNRQRTVAVLALLLAMHLTTMARAHTLDVNTARITLRDDHIEVAMELDLLSLITLANPKHPEATDLAIADEAAFGTAVQRARDLMQAGSRLAVDGMAMPLIVTAFPSAGEVRFLAAYASANQQAHHELVALRLETTKPAREAQNIVLSLPIEVGPVLFTFIQPATRLAEAGGRVVFPVLAPQSLASSRSQSITKGVRQ